MQGAMPWVIRASRKRALVATVGDPFPRAGWKPRQHEGRAAMITGLTFGQQQHDGPALPVAGGVQLGVQAALGAADTAGNSPFWSRLAAIPQLTWPSLHCCLQRHGISRLPEVEGDKAAKKAF